MPSSSIGEGGINPRDRVVCIVSRGETEPGASFPQEILDRVPVVFRDTRSTVPSDTPDGESASDAAQQRRLVSKIAAYLGRSDEADRLADTAFGMGAGLEPVRGAGGVRNAMLLACAGRVAVSIDGDTAFRFSHVRSDTIVSSPSGKDSPERVIVGFFDGEKALRKTLEPWTGDPVHALVSPFETGEKADAPQSAGGSRVFATMAGTAGRPWFDRPQAALYATDELHSRSYRGRRQYRAMMRSPSAVLQSPAPMRTRSPFFLTRCFAVDARVLLPPFPTAGRNESFSWAAAALRCRSRDAIAHVPFCIHYDAPQGEPFADTAMADASADFNQLSLLILDYLNRHAVAEDDAGAMVDLGGQLRDLARLNDREWVRFCHTLWLNHVAATVGRGNRLLERHSGKPKWWAADLEDYLARLQDQALDADNAQARELRQDVGAIEAGRRHRAACRRYGELLAVWPEVWSAAVELNHAGEGLIP